MTTSSLINLVSATRNLDQPIQCEAFRQNSILRDLSGETVLYRHGDKTEWVYFVESGLVKYVHNTVNGEEIITGLFGSWSILGCSSILLGNRHSETSILLCSSLVRGMTVDRFRGLLREEISVANWVTRWAALEMRASLEHQLLLRDPSARSRVESFYRMMSRQCDSANDNPLQRLSIPMKQIEIAQYLGITPEHLSRVTRGLENDGIVKREKSGTCTVNLRLLAV